MFKYRARDYAVTKGFIFIHAQFCIMSQQNFSMILVQQRNVTFKKNNLFKISELAG